MLHCQSHPQQPVVYICQSNQKLLCWHCILEPYYHGRMQELIIYRRNEVKQVGKMLQETLKIKTVEVNNTLDALLAQKACKTERLREDIKFVTELISIDRFVSMHPN